VQINGFVRGTVVDYVDVKGHIGVAIDALHQIAGKRILIVNGNDYVCRGLFNPYAHGLTLAAKRDSHLGIHIDHEKET
jgi:hypothetical protein